MNPLFAIDIGNTNTGYAIFKDFSSNDIHLIGKFKTSNIFDDLDRVFLEISKHLNPNTYLVLSSVVPSATNLLHKILLGHVKRSLVIKSKGIDTIVNIGNEKTGADRICTMAGAYSIYKTDVAVVDFGTATTVSVVDKNARYIAGAILPGIELMLKCLHNKTAQLPHVKIRTYDKATTIDTELSILSGVITGTAGAIERIIKDIEKENGFVLQLILTGGMVDIIKEKITLKHDVNHLLVFEGMRNIFMRNLR